MRDHRQDIRGRSPILWAIVCELVFAASGSYAALGLDPSVIATPAGSRYSISHNVFGDPDGPGPQTAQCIRIFSPNLPGAPDDIVLFDGADETVRTDVFGTVATVSESVEIEQEGVFHLTFNTFSPVGTDLFPSGLTNSVGQAYVNGCFSVGIDDLLDWPGIDVVLQASITLRKDGVIIQGPTNITTQLNPWLGQFNRVLPNALGKGVNHVQLEMLVLKSVTSPTSDDCFNAFPVSTGDISFSTVGASTDGPNEPETCAESGSAQIDADIWFHHTSQCTGDLMVDLCDSFFDTRLAIYSGCTECPPGSAPVGCNDDAGFCGPFGEQSKLTISAVAGQCYTIRIGGFRGDQGPGTMSISCVRGSCCKDGGCTDGLNRSACEAGEGLWFPGQLCGSFACPAPPPPNDDCVHAIPLTTGVPYDGTTLGASGTEVSSCSDRDTADAWHVWTADCTGQTRIGLCESDFDTTLALFDACGGTEIACSEDACGANATRSQITLSVSQGQQLYMRVAGYIGDRGDYRIVVDPCMPESQACCLPNGTCVPGLPALCLQVGGTPRGPGSTCRGNFNGNNLDDGCEPCPPGFFADSKPLDDTVDARQPHAAESLSPLQGIGSHDDPIVLTLLPIAPNLLDCFQLCESAADPNLGPNDIAEVVSLPGGKYRIVLDRPITPNAATTIEYLGGEDFVKFVSHPANVNADSISNAADINSLIACCLDASCVPLHGDQSCDIDRSGARTPADLITLINMLNGALTFDPALGVVRSGEENCP